MLSQQLTDSNHMISDLQGANSVLTKKLKATDGAVATDSGTGA